MKKSKYAEKMVDLVEDYLLKKGVSPDFTIEELYSDEDYFAIRLEHDASGHLFTYELGTLYDAHESEDVKIKDQFKDCIKSSVKNFITNHQNNISLRNDYETEYNDEEYDEDDFDDDFDDFEDDFSEEDELTDEDITEAEYAAEINEEHAEINEEQNEPETSRDMFLRLTPHQQELVKKWNSLLLTEEEEAELFQIITFEQAMSIARECGDLLTESNPQEQNDLDELDDMVYESSVGDDIELRLLNRDYANRFGVLPKSPESETVNMHIIKEEIEDTDMVKVLYSKSGQYYCSVVDLPNILISEYMDRKEQELEGKFKITTIDSVIPRPIRIAARIPEDNLVFLSNETESFGAVHLLNHTAMEAVRDALGTDDFYIVPSSVHELTCVKNRDDLETQNLYELVKEANTNNQVVSSELEVLSNCIYRYNFEERKITVDFPLEEEQSMDM